MSYLEEAAALLRKAVDENERLNNPAHAYSNAGAHEYRRALIEGRERIAEKFAQLGAIERGIVPASMVHDLLAAIRDGEK